MTARKFTKGDRVVATEDAYDSGIFSKISRPVRGVVSGNARDRLSVSVRLDGEKRASTYRDFFWKIDHSNDTTFRASRKELEELKGFFEEAAEKRFHLSPSELRDCAAQLGRWLADSKPEKP
jgi:hypothetical protein